MQITILSFQNLSKAHQPLAAKRNLSVVQFIQQPVNSFDYISSTIAIKSNYIEVTENDDIFASVQEILVKNNSESYVFFSAGDILVGAMQNRVVNTSMLLPPNSKTKVPVSCIEQGRWSNTSKKFDKSDHVVPNVLYSKINSNTAENLKKEKKYDANQQEVWNDIGILFMRRRETSYTSDLEELINKESKKRNDEVRNFIAEKDANGMAVFVGSELARIEIFNRTDIYQEYFSKVINSVIFDFENYKQENFIIDRDFAFTTVNDFLSDVDNLKYFVFPSVGVGEQKRYEHKNFTGFTLNYLEHMIHTSFISKNVSKNQPKHDSDLPF